MAILKLKVPPSTFSALFDELRSKSGRFQIEERRYRDADSRNPMDYGQVLGNNVNFVRIMPGERKFDGEQVEMTLELTEEILDARESEPNRTRKIDREMIDKLWDILGIFPRDPGRQQAKRF